MTSPSTLSSPSTHSTTPASLSRLQVAAADSCGARPPHSSAATTAAAARVPRYLDSGDTGALVRGGHLGRGQHLAEGGAETLASLPLLQHQGHAVEQLAWDQHLDSVCTLHPPPTQHQTQEVG